MNTQTDMLEITDLKLKDKVAVITGGYGHLGQAMTSALLEAGAITIVAGKDKLKFDETFDTKSKRIEFESLDISSTGSIKDCFDNIFQKHKKIDILVNNAFILRVIIPMK